MTATHGKKSQIILTSSPSLSFTNLVLLDSGDHKTFTVPPASSAKRYWDSTATFTYQTSPDGTTWSTATPANVRYLSGQIVFASAVTGATPSARVSAGYYFPWAALAWADSWAPDVSRDVKDDTRQTTTSSPAQWRTVTAGLLTGTIKISGYIVDATVSNLSLLNNSSPLIASMVFDVTTGARIECSVLPTKDSVKSVVGDLETEELDFQITGSVNLLLS
jgi:hypothetical protein